MGIIASLLFLRSNFFFVKQNTILHVLEKVKKTQVKDFGEEPGLLGGLLKALFMLVHNFLLVHCQLLFKLLAGLLYLGCLQLKLL